jgi:hypothetical protein
VSPDFPKAEIDGKIYFPKQKLYIKESIITIDLSGVNLTCLMSLIV